jgi:hypothetical protein
MARGMSEQETEAVVARVLADPFTRRVNSDGGAAAVQFIREAAAGLHNRPGDRQAKRDAADGRWREILASLGR